MPAVISAMLEGGEFEVIRVQSLSKEDRRYLNARNAGMAKPGDWSDSACAIE